MASVLFRQMRLAEAKDGDEGLVDAPLLFWTHPAYKLAESSGIDRPDLLNQDPGDLSHQVDLGAERRLPSAAGRWRDQYH